MEIKAGEGRSQLVKQMLASLKDKNLVGIAGSKGAAEMFEEHQGIRTFSIREFLSAPVVLTRNDVVVITDIYITESDTIKVQQLVNESNATIKFCQVH